MAKRSPEEIQAQREAWLARKTARAAGQDVPIQSPAASAEAVAEAPAEPEVTPEPVVETPAPEAAVAQPPTPSMPPQAPASKRTPEEIRAQREAFLAAKAAKAAGVAAPPPAPAPKPVEAAPAPAPAAKPVEVAKPVPKPRTAEEAAPKPAPAQKAPAEKIDPNITRREFLNYAWLASIALFTVETVALSLWFAFPNFKEGQFGGAFPIGDAATALPEVNSDPKAYVDGKFWLINIDTEVNGEPRQGILAIYKVCTHLGCLYEWVPITTRFECPCHGSKFQLSGDYISGPARRSLDSFVIQAVSPDGSIKETDPTGGPLEINGDETLIVDTGRRILGDPVLVPA
ncbi:MAG TPA: Rieske 2Fe-2S domain-containing protein [Anaerolineae bacterium]|nr:Rieske 2Fe-2S domain-containing protein [Anaerolineae bacterium]HXV98385.1 Rieske 2Fe-2S domain-containing protein [Anaerolineae bacterium]